MNESFVVVFNVRIVIGQKYRILVYLHEPSSSLMWMVTVHKMYIKWIKGYCYWHIYI